MTERIPVPRGTHPPGGTSRREGLTRRHLFLFLPLAILVAGCHKTSNDGSVGTQTNLDRTAWSKLKKGMTEEQVRTILGEPTKVETQEGVTAWHYHEPQPLEKNPVNPSKWVVPRGSLLFTAKGNAPLKLTEWREP
jgi:hypothetical protein